MVRAGAVVSAAGADDVFLEVLLGALLPFEELEVLLGVLAEEVALSFSLPFDFDFDEVPEELPDFVRLRDDSAGAAVGRGSAPKKTCGCAEVPAAAGSVERRPPGAPRARGTVDDSSAGAGVRAGGC